MPEITPEKALEILDRAVSQLNVNRETQFAFLEATRVLAALISPQGRQPDLVPAPPQSASQTFPPDHVGNVRLDGTKRSQS